MDSLERLRDLHDDLIAFSESRLADLDRLAQELEASIDDFRRLLDKSSQNNASRESLGAGKITIDEQEYAVNQDFREISLQVAASLDIDETEAARLVFQAQENESSPNAGSLISTVIGNFHERRDLLLQCLRLAIQESNEAEEGSWQAFLQDVCSQILNTKDGPPSNGSEYLRKCLRSLEDIEKWQVRLGEQIQSRTILGQTIGLEIYSTLDFQRSILFKQHEALAVIVAFLFRGDYTISEDLRKLLDVPKRWDRLDVLLVHYMPAFWAAFAQYGSSDRSNLSEGTRSLHKAILLSPVPQSQSQPHSILSPFYAVLRLWWISEYSGHFRDSASPQSVRGVDGDDDSRQCVKAVKSALEENALEYLLSICTTLTSDDWNHPARSELVSLLLSDSIVVTVEGDDTSTYFRILFMECLESFSEAWITNLPDSIRQLKSEEDDQRLQYITAMQDGLGSNIERHTAGHLNLEAFLVLISFAFDQRPEAAEQFWEDPDSNLFGFLQWSSKRQTVPRVSAFCEMMCSISQGPECATAAHKFLLDESAPTSSKTRRSPSMNYYQMLAELELYARKIHERPTTSQMPHLRKVLPTDMNELESPVMLSCYMRLMAHLCRENPSTREFILQHTQLDFTQTLLTLSSGQTVPSYLKASVFTTLEALMTDKTFQTASYMWRTIDQWASCGYTVFNQITAQAGQVPPPSVQQLQSTLNSIAVSYDQYDAFLVLLRNLLTFPIDITTSGQALSFPDDLGSSYRTAGISPYIDYVCGQLFAKRILELSDESQMQLSRYHCLDIMAICLDTFNEAFVAANASKPAAESSTQSIAAHMSYCQRHPFARVMEWLLNENVNANLMTSTHMPVDSVRMNVSFSPVTAGLQRSIDVLNKGLEYQPTFLDIVRPLLRGSVAGARVPISAITCIEDGIIGKPSLISDLCFYAASDNQGLVVKSLSLLQRLSTLRKLNLNPTGNGASRSNTNRLIDMLGPNASSDLADVSKALALQIESSVREIEAGPSFPAYAIKSGILSFLQASLASQQNVPNIAHLLLGFARAGNYLIVEPNGLLENGSALFNAILGLVHEYLQGDERTCLSWLLHIKEAGMQVLRLLWSSALSSELTMIELRRYNFLQTQFIGQSLVSQNTLWDDCNLADHEFWSRSSGDALAAFMTYRASLFEYTASEIRSASHSGLTALQKAALATVMGRSNALDGTQILHPTLLDLFDFADLDIMKPVEMPQLRFFADVKLEKYALETADDAPFQYDINAIEQILDHCISQLSTQTQAKSMGGEEQMQMEFETIITSLEAENRWIVAQAAKSQALHMWVEAIIAVLECCPIEAGAKLQLVLRVLQVILPKLDTSVADETQADTIDLARAADALLNALTQLPADQIKGRTETMAMDKLFQLFRSSLEGVTNPTSTPPLREILYSVCSQYLGRLAGTADGYYNLRRNAMDCLRSAGVPLITIISGDADDGEEGCRLSALNLMSMLSSLSRSEKSPYVIETLVRVNALEMLIEPLKHIASEFQDTEPTDRPSLLEVLQARLLLLLEISRTRDGASHLLEANLLQSIRDSMLFRADPDLGMDVDNAQALHDYYELVASLLRLLVSTFLARGLQNEQCQFFMRSFLQDYRPNMVGLFKRALGVNGRVGKEDSGLLDEIIRAYTALTAMSGFVEFEEDAPLEGFKTNGFS